MIAEIHDRLKRTRERVRRVIVWSGISWLMIVAMAVIAAAGFTDWLFHISSELRLLFLVVLGGALAWTAFLD